ncbi:histidine phosphatase family protein [Calidifontibacter sp. DB0510]|uniref:Histidine phosphatase family protein n=1 Tax=Metallococcus carri TaxID=1656884 RepID=A0A967B0B0_9MICO|nr:histidine phosphatase family protein [Metallococcus carri]NHN55717.1 histidine phosphatase family protein [Metallococcus carri]NOP38594.1 histidine phosphatase family protein [Calidifontibacter sp. DB2511S]
MSDSPRRLIAIRHAKAEAADSAPDHERNLTERGSADARALGAWFKEHGLHADFVWCSTAARTRQTWAEIVEASASGGLVDHEQRIYNASVPTLLQVLRETPKKARTVAIVGHAPGIPGLVAVLSEGSAQPAELEQHFVTAAAAVLDVPVEWAELAPGTCTVEALHVGRADNA